MVFLITLVATAAIFYAFCIFKTLSINERISKAKKDIFSSVVLFIVVVVGLLFASCYPLSLSLINSIFFIGVGFLGSSTLLLASAHSEGRNLYYFYKEAEGRELVGWLIKNGKAEFYEGPPPVSKYFWSRLFSLQRFENGREERGINAGGGKSLGMICGRVVFYPTKVVDISQYQGVIKECQKLIIDAFLKCIERGSTEDGIIYDIGFAIASCKTKGVEVKVLGDFFYTPTLATINLTPGIKSQVEAMTQASVIS